jgi:hypothetical protein
MGREEDFEQKFEAARSRLDKGAGEGERTKESRPGLLVIIIPPIYPKLRRLLHRKDINLNRRAYSLW